MLGTAHVSLSGRNSLNSRANSNSKEDRTMRDFVIVALGWALVLVVMLLVFVPEALSFNFR